MKKLSVIFLTILSLFYLMSGVSCQSNSCPMITSAVKVEASGGIYFVYRAAISGSGSTTPKVYFSAYPEWLQADADSLFGIPHDGLTDTSFTVIVTVGGLSDTITVELIINPTLVVYGDTRTGHEYHQQIINRIKEVKPTAVFHAGDLVNDGKSTSDWTIFNNITAEYFAEIEFYPSLGNHERQSQLYFDNFELPNNEQWYAIDKNNCHFIMLNSCVDLGPESEQYQWLAADLASIPETTRFIAAIFHHPPYSTGRHDEDEMGIRDTWVPLFEQYGVDIVFNGHDHHYERSDCNGIHYIISGGGGAPLRNQDRESDFSQLYLKVYHFCKLSVVDNRLIVKVYDINAELIDQFELTS